MITIRLGKWCDHFGKKYRYKRIYIKGYKWSPFVKKRKRSHKGVVTPPELVEDIKE